jgi:hypothetical protein
VKDLLTEAAAWCRGKNGLLPYDHVIAFLFWALANASMLVCLTADFWLTWRMMTDRD